MNLPTKLTFLRILMIPAFVAVFFIEFTGYRFVALGFFAVACFTDFLDGYIARKYNMVTTLGKFLDPIADKLLVACALIAVTMVQPFNHISSGFQLIVGICTMIILCRELMVSAFRIIAATKNVILAADIWGKLKTNFQMVSMLLLIPYVSVYAINAKAAMIVFYIGFALLAIAAIFTVLSGANYIIKNKEVLLDAPKEESKASSEVGAIAQILVRNNYKLGIAESFTGGRLASAFTAVKGASEYLREGLVCYSLDSKEQRLNVTRETLDKFGAISKECIAEMLEGVIKSGADLAIATSGNAEPDESGEGLGFVGVRLRDKIIIQQHIFKSSRNENINSAVNIALDLAHNIVK